jgi:hypothetical protein
MLQKFLMIGVGGSGGTTLRYVWRELDRRLRSVRWEDPMPQGWQFLHIDVPENVDVIAGDVPADVGPNHHYLGLAQAPQEYAYYDSELVSKSALLPSLAGWRPDPRLDYTNPYLGAGQRRVVGRIVTLTQLDRVKQAITAAVRTMTTDEADAQLLALGRKLGADTIPVEPTAVVISSMGGGAGSGAFLDVIETLRSNAAQGAQWANTELLTVLYAADVFYDLDEELRVGVEPNSLAALAELLAATEHEGPIPEPEQHLLAAGAGSHRIVGRRAGQHTFMVGSKNNSVSLDSSLHVFRSVGKALATFMIDPHVQQELRRFVITNTNGRPCAQTFTLADAGRCAAFGYASVSLGRSLFAEYATERLAKKSLNRLLRGYRADVVDAHLRSDRSLIEEKVARARAAFFEASGLWELGPEHNQVLDALRDRQTIGQMLDNVVEEVKKFFERGGKDERGRVEASIRQQFAARAATFQAQAKLDLDSRTHKWAQEVQQRVLDATAQFVGDYGLDVGIQLLVALSEQVLEAASELRGQRINLLKEGKEAGENFSHLFARFQDKIGWQHDDVNKGIGHQRKGLQKQHAAGVCDTAASLLEEVATAVLEPLQRELIGARENLARAEHSSEFAAKVNQWAVGEVPAHLRAAPNELLVDKQTEAPAMLETMFNAMVDDAGADSGESAAIREIISRAWPSRMKDVASSPRQQLVARRKSWVPDLASLGVAGAAAGSQAAFTIGFDPGTLERDARQWVYVRRGPLSDHVNETLAEWLAPGRTDSTENAEIFADNIQIALRSSAPLISINPDVHAAVHGGLPPDPTLIISEIPVAPDHLAARRIIDSLAAAGVRGAVAQRLFNPNSPAREVSISSFSGRYVHPIVFDSLTGPINDQWRTCTDQPSRNEFWAFRRSRPLQSFIPVSNSRQRALVRGWLVAEVLGYVDRLEDSWSAKPLSVWTPRGTRTFPRWLLGRDVTDAGSVLPALLESLPLALVSYTGDEDDELNAYLRLLELGSSGAGIGDHSRANPELERWIRTGTTTPAQPTFDPAPVPRVGSADDLPDERLTAVMAVFTEYEEAYRTGIGSKEITPETTLIVGRTWEAHQLISSAALELIRSSHGIETKAEADQRSPAIPVPKE